MNSIIEPIACEGISRTDMVGVKGELERYHALYAPLLDVVSSARKVGSISRD